MAKRIGIFIDGSNLYESVKSLGFMVDFVKLKEYYKTLGDVTRLVYFTALPPKEVVSPLRPLVDFIEYNGYTLIQKETKTYYNAITQETKLKGNMDVEIAVHSLEVAPYLDSMVLFSGDGDFRCLIESLQRVHGLHCTVVSARSLVADSLRRQANEFIDLSTLKDKLIHDDTGKAEREALRNKRFGFLKGD